MKALVIVVNRARPDYFGYYGNDWLPTPHLDRLAADSVVFDQHFSDCPRPRAARRVWQNGTFGYLGRTDRDAGLAELLWDHNVRTWLIGDERSPSLGLRFASGWEMQRWVRREDLERLEQENLLGGVVQAAVDWLEHHGTARDWLLWLELGTLQLPWDEAEFPLDTPSASDDAKSPWFDPPEGLVEDTAVPRLQQTYGGLVQGVDDWLGQLLEFLRGQGLYDDLLLLLTSDAGLPLGDHGFVGEHRPWLHEELVHLPLLVKLPGGKQAGRRVQHFTQPVDLLPTLLDAFGVNKEATDGDISSPGRSLLKLSRGEPTRLLEYACSVARLRGHEEWSIRTHQWHLIVPVAGTAHPSRNPLLYVKPDDRWEVNNVLSQHPDVAEHLELALRRFLGAAEDGMNALPELRAEVLKPQ